MCPSVWVNHLKSPSPNLFFVSERECWITYTLKFFPGVKLWDFINSFFSNFESVLQLIIVIKRSTLPKHWILVMIILLWQTLTLYRVVWLFFFFFNKCYFVIKEKCFSWTLSSSSSNFINWVNMQFSSYFLLEVVPRRPQPVLLSSDPYCHPSGWSGLGHILLCGPFFIVSFYSVA